MNYDSYLQLDKILTAQHPISFLTEQPKHDEMFFVILHQTHELWFKQILYEIDFIINEFSSSKVNLPSIINKFERIIRIIYILIESVHAIETLSPIDFLEFRKLLTPVSGLHSQQFKLMLYKFGLHQEHKDNHTLFHAIDKWLSNLFSAITNENSFNQAYFRALESWANDEICYIKSHKELDGSKKELFVKKIQEHAQYCKKFLSLESYTELIKNKSRVMSFNASRCILFIFNSRDNSHYFIYYTLISLLQKVDLLIAKWQMSHAQMVKNIIGNKLGTGGAYTAEELMKSKKMAFHDISEIVSLVIPKPHCQILFK